MLMTAYEHSAGQGRASVQTSFYVLGNCVAILGVIRDNWETLQRPDMASDLSSLQITHRQARGIANRYNLQNFPHYFDSLKNIDLKQTVQGDLAEEDQQKNYRFFVLGFNMHNLGLHVAQAVDTKTFANENILGMFQTAREHLTELKVDRTFIDRLNIIEAKFTQNSQNIQREDIKKLSDDIKMYLSEDDVGKSKEYFSEVDPSRIITDGHWLISLVRKPDGTHSEHAFLIIEGKEGNRAHIWFMDLVGSPILSGAGDGKIRLKHFEGSLEETLLLSCKLRMMDIRRGSRILSNSWAVPCDVALRLVTSVENQQRNPPKFNILGYSSVFASSTAGSSSTSTGHNCFTWAKEQLYSLDQEKIVLSDNDSIANSAFAQTSRVLPDAQALSWYQRPAAVAGIAVTGVVVGVTIGRNKCTML